MKPSNPAHTPKLTTPGRHAALYGLLVALALVAGYVEVLIPLPVIVPGLKLGLGNIVVLFALLRMGPRAAFFVMLAKIISSTLLFGTPQMALYSLAGGVLSWLAMVGASRIGIFSVVGISILGGVAHNAGQLIAVAATLSVHLALTCAPVLLIAGVCCGAIIGLIVTTVIQHLPQKDALV